ncbi:amino acid adenylation domain-containing protein [Nonomuraea sp. NPDC050556]|uniref:amino acid adenylation domain-containing protein n=1 Tax=Nonomuraea sp. NPDC050556 TaxID=3364369 RepID=UPI0037A465FC
MDNPNRTPVTDIGQRLAELPAEARARLAKRLAGTAVQAAPTTRARNRTPLSQAQERLWFIEQIEEGAVHHNDGMLLIMRGRLDLDAMVRSIEAVIERHEILRTAFVADADGPHQVVNAARPLDLVVCDLPDARPLPDDPVLLASFQAEMARPLDLSVGQLVRGVLFRLAPESVVLGITVHHLVCDLWSFAIFADEVGELYPTFLNGGAGIDKPPLPIQYGDYAAAQRAALTGEQIAAAAARRSAALRDAPPLLQLPISGTRPPAQRFVGSVERFRVDRATTDRLRDWSRNRDATLFMTLLGAFKVLLARHTGVRDIVVASPIATRQRRDVDRLIGCFLNMIVIRTDVGGEPTMADVVDRVRESCLDAYHDRDLPFEQLVLALQPIRTRSHQPIAQIAFALQNTPMEPLRLPDLEIEFHKADTGRARMDLSVWITENDQGLIGEVEYDQSIYSAAQIRVVAQQMERLLAALPGASDTAVWDIPLLTEAEVELVAVGWNATTMPSDSRSVHQIVADRATTVPDTVAVIDGDTRLTYRELDERANQLAHHLAGFGVRRGQRVAVCLPRSAGEIVAILAVMKAGAAYVPLHSHDRPERRDDLIAQAGATVVVSAGVQADEAWRPGRRVIDLDAEADDVAACPRTAPDVPVGPDDLAYVIFTSGSTGRAKGVMVTHRGFVNRMVWGQANYPLDSTHRVLRKAAPVFDVSIDELFRALMYGAASVQMSDTPGFDPRRIAAVIEDYGVTDADFSPTALRQLLHTVEPARLASLRRIVSGGEELPAETARLIRDKLDVALFNLYGPTEVSVSCTAWPVTLDERPVVPIGRPMGNVRVYVLDANGRLALPGAVGELYVGGPGLAHGYLGAPNATAASFVPDPFSGDHGARLYRTGDLVRWGFRPGDDRPWAQPALEFVGRVDRQLNLRGFRIEPAQVEAALRTLPGVTDAVVVLRERLVAYLVTAQQPDINTVRAQLRTQLPDYMLPSAFVAIPAVPYTANGKVAFAELPEPAASESGMAGRYDEPRDQVERTLADIWIRILGLPRVGIHESFFDLGGDSLSAIRILASAAADLGREVEVAAIFDNPTIAELARRFGNDQETTR